MNSADVSSDAAIEATMPSATRDARGLERLLRERVVSSLADLRGCRLTLVEGERTTLLGHAAATDYTARYIRYGMMTREEAIPIIKERDGKLDPLCVRDFCEFCGYTETEFWAILDKFYNRDLFEKNEYGEWQLKHPIWEENK